MLLAGFALLACAEAGLIWSLSGDGGSSLTVGPFKLAAGAAGLVVLALATAALVRWPEATTPLVLAAAPFRLPLDVDPDARFFLRVGDSGELGRLLPLYCVLGAACLALIVRVVREKNVPALPLLAALPAAAFTAFAALSLLWTSDLEAGTTTLAFFLLPFTALVAVVARAPFPPWMPRVLAIIAVAQATLFAVIGIWQALTHELLFFAPNLEVANTYAPIFRVTSLFRDPSLYGRHVVLGIVVLVVAVWLRRIPTLPAVALIARALDRSLLLLLPVQSRRALRRRARDRRDRGHPRRADGRRCGHGRAPPRRHWPGRSTRRSTPRCGERRATGRAVSSSPRASSPSIRSRASASGHSRLPASSCPNAPGRSPTSSRTPRR